MSTFGRLVVVWTIALVAGFAIVFALGRPLPTPAEELEAALHPAPPVSREMALESATTIARLQYPQFEGIAPAVERRLDAGVDRWVVSYADTRSGVPSGLTVSVSIDRGIVEVLSYP